MKILYRLKDEYILFLYVNLIFKRYFQIDYIYLIIYILPCVYTMYQFNKYINQYLENLKKCKKMFAYLNLYLT